MEAAGGDDVWFTAALGEKWRTVRNSAAKIIEHIEARRGSMLNSAESAASTQRNGTFRAKPKGMRWRTCQRFEEGFRAYARQLDEGIAELAARLG